jgi:hypothetical protein
VSISAKDSGYYFKFFLSVLLGTVLLVSIWQLYFIFNIPDIDTDAYVHHTIARQVIMSPKDLSIHWVWLPLFHYISAGVILLGAGMDTVRIINIFIWGAIPVILFFFLYNRDRENNLLLAFLSSVFCSLFPIGILMGTTAQPEPLFALLILLFVVTASNNKFVLSSIFLTLACLLRYEAWAVLMAVFVLYINDIIKSKKIIFDKRILNFLLPGIFILIWAVLREPFDGKLFGFLFQTQKFANDALQETNSFQGGILKIIRDFIHYPVVIPVLFTGINIIFAFFGFIPCLRKNKWLMYSGISILAFITASWMFKSNLGLNRHFVSLIPLYTTMAAYGLIKVYEFLSAGSGRNKFLKAINIKYTLIIISFLSCLIYLVMWLSIWNYNYRNEFPEKKSASEYLRNIPGQNTIFCNDAIVEIFSKIDFRRFNHIWMENNPAAYELILQSAKSEGYVYVITTPEKWKEIKNIGEVIFRTPSSVNSNSAILILKVSGK